MRKIDTHFEWGLGVPVAMKLLLQCFFQLLTKDVDTTAWKLIVEVRYDKVQRNLNFNVHFRCFALCTLLMITQRYFYILSQHQVYGLDPQDGDCCNFFLLLRFKLDRTFFSFSIIFFCCFHTHSTLRLYVSSRDY